MDKVCEHTHEVTFSFTVLGYGNTKDKAAEEARRFAARNWINYHPIEELDIAKVVKNRNNYLGCSLCLEEEKREKWKLEVNYDK